MNPKATNVHIRPFQAADLAAIQRIRALAFEPVFRLKVGSRLQM